MSLRGAFLVILLASSLYSVASENLTTLEGRTYTNVTSVNTNYASLVVIQYEGGKAGIKVTSLPEAFRIKHGGKLQDKPVTGSGAPQQTNSTEEVDTFLAAHTNSILSSSRDAGGAVRLFVFTNEPSAYAWAIYVHADSFSLFTYKVFRDSKEIQFDPPMKLKFAEVPMAAQMFDKFIEWEGIASKTRAEDFQKLILSSPDHVSTEGLRRFTFSWMFGSASLIDADDSKSSIFSSEAVVHFKEFLNLIPVLKAELAQKIKSQEAQKNLFK